MKVDLEIEIEEMEGDYGQVDGIRVTCSKCGHEVEVFGTGEASAKRGEMMLAEDCPMGERNFYDIGQWG